MAKPRKVSVAVAAGLVAGPVDVIDDLVSFTFEETAQGVGESLDITVDNASGYYTTIWWIEKGTAAPPGDSRICLITCSAYVAVYQRQNVITRS